MSREILEAQIPEGPPEIAEKPDGTSWGQSFTTASFRADCCKAVFEEGR